MQRIYSVSLTKNFFSETVILPQYDENYQLVFKFVNNEYKSSFDGKSAYFEGTRNDGLSFRYSTVVSGNTATFVIDRALTAINGEHKGQIVLYDNTGLRFGSSNVKILVEKAARPDNAIDADVTSQQTLLEQIQEIVDTAAETVGDRINEFFTEKATDNLFNKDDATIGSYINPYSGDVGEYDGVFRELIEFEEGSYTFLAQPGVFGTNAYVVAMFDENENFVSYAQGTHTEIDSMSSIVTVTFSSQATTAAKYFNVNGTTDILNTLMVVKGTRYPTEYIEYGTYKTIDGLQISKSQIIDLDDETNPLKGKIISINGDSIAAGVGYQGGYGKIIAEENGMTYENIAVGGGTVAYVSSNVHCISRTIANMRSDADYIILDGGGNDADSGVTLGTLSTGYDATLDDTTFAGAFENMLKSAIARFPNKKIGYVFVHKCAYLFSSSVENSYYGIAKAACEKWGIPYCDLNTQTPPLNYISSLKTAYTANGDGYHPNEQGYRLFYVPKITAWMKTL